MIATTGRVLRQLRHDPRTVVLLIAVPALLMVLLRFVFDSAAEFARIAPALLGIFPFLLMFLITSIATLRERTSGTLERLMTMPLPKLGLLTGYGTAFGLVALVQVAVTSGVSLWLGLTVAGPIAWLLVGHPARRPARRRPRPAGQRVRQDGVPGHPADAGRRPPPAAAVRSVPAAR